MVKVSDVSYIWEGIKKEIEQENRGGYFDDFFVAESLKNIAVTLNVDVELQRQLED
tara:strand:+ start:349 stop:516 length:168 start_codon:yes stop_codon:yes gene_type:complete